MQTLRFETAIGACAVRWTEAGISGVLLPGMRERNEPAAEAPAFVLDAVAGMRAVLAGERLDLREIVLDESGIDDFRRAVYAATRAVGPGETVSYGEIARVLGDPGAARAVGAALGANPFPIIVPCHRVLASTGALHGFSAPGGLTTKRRMLELEGAPGFCQTSLFA
jgi:methylated-DNA-[protein]-cysteine S-methyltransferase